LDGRRYLPKAVVRKQLKLGCEHLTVYYFSANATFWCMKYDQICVRPNVGLPGQKKSFPKEALFMSEPAAREGRRP
jgi:hypothetical protein